MASQVSLSEGVGTAFVAETVLRLSGDDHRTWLQGQITQDVRKLSPGEPQSTCFLSATGQLQAIGRLHDHGDAIFVVTGQPDVVRGRVDDFVIMEEVELATVEEGVQTIHGAAAEAWLAHHAEPGTWGRHDRTPFPGFDVFVPPFEFGSLPVIEAEEMAALGFAAGIPRFGVDTNAKTLPPELGKAFDERTISYTKGCYLGQEVVMRIHSRGHVNRQWVALKMAAAPSVGAEVTRDGVVVGSVMQAFRLSGSWFASAMVRRESAEPGTEVLVGGVPAIVRPLPLDSVPGLL